MASNYEDENQFERLQRASWEKGQLRKVADAREACLHVEEGVHQTPSSTGGGIELDATSTLCVVPDAITVARGDTVVWINELLREISRSLEMTIYVGAIDRDHVHMLLGIRSL